MKRDSFGVRRLLRYRVALVLFPALCASCGARDVVIEYREVEHRFSREERRTIERIAQSAVAEARLLLAALPETIVLRIDVDDNVSVVTNAAAISIVPNRVYWSVDADRGGGIVATAETHLRAMLFHEMHHLVRDTTISRVSLMDHVISEGMASVFERDYAGASYPFTEYPADVADWVAELVAIPASTDVNQWMFRHPDGRRWIGFRAGTYLVERAMAASGGSAAELVATPTLRVMELAESYAAKTLGTELSIRNAPTGSVP